MPELDDIYSARILELAASISHIGRLASPDATAVAHSKLCGSTVTADLQVADSKIADFGQVVKACLLGQAACAIVAREIVDTDFAEIRAIGAQMRAMLKAGGPPPIGRWADLGVLEPVRAYKGRHASVLLIFDAIENALAQIEANNQTLTATASA